MIPHARNSSYNSLFASTFIAYIQIKISRSIKSLPNPTNGCLVSRYSLSMAQICQHVVSLSNQKSYDISILFEQLTGPSVKIVSSFLLTTKARHAAASFSFILLRTFSVRRLACPQTKFCRLAALPTISRSLT
jgi:hypothetical protein